ncbi:MAG: hypothetical protein MAG431_00279 [Chloroflexi bacterium]|nr:hypothetical protein [Chloroflexota bacterium]
MQKKPLLILVIVLVLSGALIAYFSMQKTVTLVINGESQTLATFAFTVGDFLEKQAVPLKAEDALNPPQDHWLREGESVQLEQAGQIFILADGEESILITSARKPADILAEADVPLSPEDQIYVDGELTTSQETLSYQPSHSMRVTRATSITLFVDGREQTFTSVEKTLAQALWGEGFRLREGDDLSPAPGTPLTGQPLQARLTPARELTIRLPGNTVRTLSTATTVGEALAGSGTALQGLDYSLPGESESIPEDGEIQVVRVREDIILEQEPIPYGLTFQSTNEVEIDSQKILNGGEYGVQARRIRVRYENGEEVSRNVEKEWVAKEPQPRVVGYGTKITVRTANTADGPIEYWRKITAYATSYSPCRSGTDECWHGTSSGKEVKKGVIAVIRSWYLYMQGMAVYIPGYGFATIEDVGGGVSGTHWVDLGYSDASYVPWSENVTVYFLTPVPPPENIMWVLE